jgi:CheY-like chemotaxis protein
LEAARTHPLQVASGPVLVVEDDLEIRAALEYALIDEGFDVVTTTNGQEALDYLQQSSNLPFVILLDLRMPVMDGREFLAMRASEPLLADIPVIVLTADFASARTVPTGASSLLIKPFGLERLLEEISRHR